MPDAEIRSSKARLRLQVLPVDRQFAQALAGGLEDRVGERRRHRRHARLADTAWRRIALHQMNVDLARRVADAGHLVVVEVALLDAALLGGDLAKDGSAEGIDDGALHLRL